MEQEFDVEIKEVLSRVQKVKAESLDDAINKAMDMYYAEQIVLGAEDSDGRISEQGTHDELMAKAGIYQDFVNIRKKASGWSLA